MANDIKVSQIVEPFAEKVFKNLVILMNSNKQFNKNFKGGNGSTMYISIPDPGSVGEGKDITSLDRTVVETQVPLTLTQYNAAADLDQVEEALEIGNFQDQIAYPRGTNLANQVEQKAANAVLLLTDNVIVSSAASYDDLSDLVAYIREARAIGELNGALAPTLASKISKTGNQFFNSQKALEKTWMTGAIGEYHDAMYYNTPNVLAFTAGTYSPATSATITTTVSADGATSISITDSTATGLTVAAGQVFYVDGVNSVDIYGNAISVDKAFIAQTSATGSAGAITITVAPLYFTGAGINCSTIVAAGASVSSPHEASTRYIRGIVWEKSALAFGMASLKPIRGAETAKASFEGVEIIGSYLGGILSGENTFRWDTLVGFTLPRPQWTGRYDVKVA